MVLGVTRRIEERREMEQVLSQDHYRRKQKKDQAERPKPAQLRTKEKKKKPVAAACGRGHGIGERGFGVPGGKQKAERKRCDWPAAGVSPGRTCTDPMDGDGL